MVISVKTKFLFITIIYEKKFTIFCQFYNIVKFFS